MARLTGSLLCATALLLCAVTTTQAYKCRSGCGGVTPNIFKYQEGTTYKYNLEGNVDISLSSAEGQRTSTKVTGVVLLTQQPECNQVLRIQNLQVIGPDAKKYSGLANIDKPIRLNFHDGHVEPVICTDPADTQHSLNIKRAVASLFQAALGHHGDEQDVFGHCHGDVSQRKEGNHFIIQKTRDLTRCSNREAIKQDFMSTSFNLKAVAGTGPVFASYESEQRLKNGILEHATVTENYLYKPFSDGKDHGAKAIVTTKLTFVNQKKENVNAKVSEPRSIYFEAPHQETTKSANVDSILNALKETKKTMDVSVSEHSASTFLQLIKVLRASRKDDILAVYGQVKTGAGGFQDKQGARKVFFDALFRTGTGEAVEVIVELLKNNELSAVEQKLVYLSFSFIRHATKGSLTSAAALLDLPNIQHSGSLYQGIGTLAGRYCSEHPCSNIPELTALQNKLLSKLTPQPTTRHAENEALSAIKALSSIGHHSDSVADKLAALMLQAKAPTRLRVAALEAAAEDACHTRLQGAAMKVLKDKEEDAELRIKAYLVLVECVDGKVAQSIKEVMDDEPVYQVGGYISTHLANIRASSSPDRERAQQYLGHIRPARTYPVDPRKYSFNTELGYSWDTLGAAETVQADVIYSQKSWMPRSVAVNVSGDILGHRVQMVEIDVRQENLDKVIEHYFGPLGVLAKYETEELYKDGKDSVDKFIEHVKNRLEKTRGKRDVSKSEIDAFAKTVKILGSDFNKDLDLDLSLKIFGSELLFLSLNEDIQNLTPTGFVDLMFDVLDQGLDKAKNFEYHLKNHMLLVDVDIAYPTATGFPLRWDLQGTAAVHFITSGQVDIRQILKDPKNAQVHMKLIPSANIEFSGGIFFDAHFLRSGLRITTNVLSSTGSDLTVKLLDNKGVDVKLGLPVEKQKLVSFSHTLDFYIQELGKPQVIQQLKFKDKPREFQVCFDQLSPLIGLTFCGEFNAPSTLASNHVGFPLNGNINLEVSIEREDVTEYHFKALLDESKPHTKAISLTFDTPGSKTNRHLALLLEATSTPQRALRATLTSPFKEAVAEAVITDTEAEKSAMVRFQHDTQEYLAKLGVRVQGGGDRKVYTPLVEYSTPGDVVKSKGNRKPDYTVEGQIIVENHGGKFTFDHVKLIAPGQPPIQINGYLSKDGPTTFSADLQVSRESVNVAAKGKVQYGSDHLKINGELQNSVNPSANFNIKVDLNKKEREFDNSITVIHGADLSSKKHCLSLSQSAKYKYESGEVYDFSMKNKLTYPLVGLEVKLDSHTTNKHFSYDAALAYDKFKMESELDAKVANKQPGDYDIKFELEVMSNKLQLEAKRDVEGEKSKVHNLLEITGRKYQVDGVITHHVKPNDINIGTDLVIKVHDKPEAIKVDTGLISNLHTLDSHAKILVGSNAVVDIVIKGSRGANPNGSLKIVIQKVIIANGNFKMTGGKGTGQIVVEFPKIDRKIKAETQITCQSPIHNAVVNVYFDFEKDNSKKLHFETNNHVTKTSYDTKNKLEILDKKLAFNSKGQMTGSLNDGTVNGQFDLTLTCGDVISGSLNRELHEVDDVANGNVHATLQHQHGDIIRKIDIKGALKDTNFKKGILDGEWNIAANEQGGKDAKLDLVLKHNHDGEKHHSLYKTKIHGSILPHALTSSIEGTYTREEGSHQAAVLYGSSGLKLNTKYNSAGAKHAGQPISGALDVELLLPNDHYKSVKLAMNGQAKRPQQEDGVYEADGSISATLNNEKTLKLAGSTKASKHNGQVHLDLTLPNEEPLGFGAKYSGEKSEKGGKVHGEVDLKYGKGKEVKAGLTLNKVSDDEADVELNLVTPSDAAKNINLQIKNKRSSNNKHFTNEIILTADGKRYSSSNELVISDISPLLDIVVHYPDGKQSRILAKFTRIAPKQFKGELKLLSIHDFSLEASGEANLASVDDFHILVNVHSPKLNLEKVKFEASNKPAKGGKKIQFSAKSGDQNILSGSTSYKANEEGGKLIVEGSGSVKVREDTRTATFKFMKQQLDHDGEHGVEVLLNAGVGSQGIVAELKLTNKQFRLLNSYCEEKKQCAHVEIFSKTNQGDASEFNHELEINIDLRKLGLSHEFGLKSVTNRKDFILDHTVDIHFESSASSKYQYSLYIHPQEAGIQFTTPKRVISLEAKADVNQVKGKQGTIKGSVALYLNKNTEPNKKTLLTYTSSHQLTDHSGNTAFEVKLSYPGVSKDLGVTYSSKYDSQAKKSDFSLDLDVFSKKNQKLSITGNTHIEQLDGGYKFVTDGAMASKGFNLDCKVHEVAVLTKNELDYEFKLNYQMDKTKLDNAVVFKVNPKHAELLVKALNKNLLHLDTALELSQNSQVSTSTFNSILTEELLISTESKNFNTLVVSIAKRTTPATKLRLSGGVVLGQHAEVRLEVERGAAKTDIAHALLQLDEKNFLKPDFAVNTEYIEKHLVPSIKKEQENAINKLKPLVEDLQKTAATELQHLKDLSKKSLPNLKPALEYYKQELGKLKDELVSDKTIQEVSDFLRKVFGAVAGTLSEVYTRLAEVSEKLVEIGSENFSKITDTIAKDILPPLKTFIHTLLDTYLSLLRSLYDLAALYLVKLSNLLSEHQAELQQFATALGDASQDLGRVIVKFTQQVQHDVEQLAQSLYEQLKALPVVEELKRYYHDLVQGVDVSEQVLGMVGEVCGMVKDVMPTEEAKEFVGVVQDYVARKLRHETIDDTEALKQIYTAFIRAINSLTQFLQDQGGASEASDYKTLLKNIVPFRLDRLSALPELAAGRITLLNLVLGGDLPSPKQLLWGRSLHPRDNIPPFAHHGLIVQGQHIFTFDDRHLTFPGACSYILAKDAVHNNFTLVGQYKGGALDALTFTDQHDVITLSHSLQVTLNGHPSELPIRSTHLQVFRLYDSLHLKSKAGVHVIASPHLEIVSVHVNGFYHGQVRGLLGNANFEPYDDFTLPNGKLTGSEADLGNAYRLQASCAAVQTVDHASHHANPKCDALFGEDSAFKPCYPFIHPRGYQQACEHGLGAQNPHTEKWVAMAYVAKCTARLIPIWMPADLIQCTNSDKPVALDEQFSVKVPSKAADVVVVVEQNKANEAIFKDLVQPVITQLTNELNAKGISDIEFSLIGYGGEYPDYPSHYTQGGKLAFHGAAGSLKFADAKPRPPPDTGCSRTDALLRQLQLAEDELEYQLVMNPEADALREAMRYPFRAHAARVILMAKGSNKDNFSLLRLLGSRYVSEFSRKDGIHVSVVQTLDGLKSTGGKDKQLKSIVGFNEHGAFTLADHKKKGDGNAELLKDLDWGLDHTVDYVLHRHGGNVFLANTFSGCKGGQKKQFVQVMAHAMAEDIINTELGMDCKCSRNSVFGARNACQVVSVKEKEPRKTGVKH